MAAESVDDGVQHRWPAWGMKVESHWSAMPAATTGRHLSASDSHHLGVPLLVTLLEFNLDMASAAVPLSPLANAMPGRCIGMHGM